MTAATVSLSPCSGISEEPSAVEARPGLARSVRLNFALAFGSSQWLLYLVVQTGSLLAFALPPSARNAASYWALVRELPLMQGQNVLLAALLAVLAYLALAHRVTFWALFGVCLWQDAYLLANQAYYRFTLSNLWEVSLDSMARVGPVQASSLRQGAWVLGCSFAVMAAVNLWFASKYTSGAVPRARLGVVLAVGAVLAVLGLLAPASGLAGTLAPNPLVAVALHAQPGHPHAGRESLGARQLSIQLASSQPRTPDSLALETVRPEDNVAVWTEWAGEPDMSAVFEWTSPEKERFVSRPFVTPSRHTTGSLFRGQDPMVAGEWTVELRGQGGIRLRRKFNVTPAPRGTPGASVTQVDLLRLKTAR